MAVLRATRSTPRPSTVDLEATDGLHESKASPNASNTDAAISQQSTTTSKAKGQPRQSNNDCKSSSLADEPQPLVQSSLRRFMRDESPNKRESPSTMIPSSYRLQPQASPGSNGSTALKRKRSQNTSPNTDVAPTSRSKTAATSLPLLTDIIRPNLLLLFIGLNPGIKTSQTQHCYAHASNLFYKLLSSSGLTTRRHSPVEDVTFADVYNYGFTNIISRPSKDGSSLKREEYQEGAKVLEAKVARFRPETVCCVGKGVWEGFFRYKHGRSFSKGEFQYGWQKDKMGVTRDWVGAWVFVAASTSGLSAGLSLSEKEETWRPLGLWISTRRTEIADDPS